MPPTPTTSRTTTLSPPPTEEALSRTGGDVGTPTITVGPGTAAPRSFFGPVMPKAPKGDEAVAFWDAVATLAHSDVAELKRTRAATSYRLIAPISIIEGVTDGHTPTPASGQAQVPAQRPAQRDAREVLAEELVRIDDERLEFVTITSIEVDNELNRAVVFFDSLSGESGDEAIIEVLEQHRRRMQSSINRQIRAKKTPVLDFRPDDVIRAAQRIDEILRI